MQNLKPVFLLFLFALVLFCFACEDKQQPSDISVEGATIQMGLVIDDDLKIADPQSTFKVDEDFYFNFNNNRPFATERVTVQLIEAHSEKVLAEHTYEVDPEEVFLTDGIYFGSAGLFLVTVRLDGNVRASSAVTIE